MFTTVFIHPWGVAFPTTNVVVTSFCFKFNGRVLGPSVGLGLRWRQHPFHFPHPNSTASSTSSFVGPVHRHGCGLCEGARRRCTLFSRRQVRRGGAVVVFSVRPSRAGHVVVLQQGTARHPALQPVRMPTATQPGVRGSTRCQGGCEPAAVVVQGLPAFSVLPASDERSGRQEERHRGA